MAKFDNSGSLRKNDRKEKPTHADYKGKATVDGVEYWLSAWIKSSDDGKWLSIAFKPKDDDTKTKDSRADDSANDEIPF